MGKGKPRHNPDKPQNQLGAVCGFAEFIPSCNFDGKYTVIYCLRGYSTKYCKGDPHKCKSAWYRWKACRSDRRKNIDGEY